MKASNINKKDFFYQKKIHNFSTPFPIIETFYQTKLMGLIRQKSELKWLIILSQITETQETLTRNSFFNWRGDAKGEFFFFFLMEPQIPVTWSLDIWGPKKLQLIKQKKVNQSRILTGILILMKKGLFWLTFITQTLKWNKLKLPYSYKSFARQIIAGQMFTN